MPPWDTSSAAPPKLSDAKVSVPLNQKHKQLRVPFVNLFKNNRMANDNHKLEFLAPGTNRLKFIFDDIDSVEKTYDICLLGYIISGKPPTSALMQGDPVELCYKEHSERGTVNDLLTYCINSYWEAAVVDNPKFDHIDLAEKQKVLNECVEAEAWLREKLQHQDSLPKHANPVLLSADVRKKAEALDRCCRPIMMKPKPAKPASTPDAPSPASSQGGESQSQGPDSTNTHDTAETGKELPPTDAQPMETDKSETAPA